MPLDAAQRAGEFIVVHLGISCYITLHQPLEYSMWIDRVAAVLTLFFVVAPLLVWGPFGLVISVLSGVVLAVFIRLREGSWWWPD